MLFLEIDDVWKKLQLLADFESQIIVHLNFNVKRIFFRDNLILIKSTKTRGLISFKYLNPIFRMSDDTKIIVCVPWNI